MVKGNEADYPKHELSSPGLGQSRLSQPCTPRSWPGVDGALRPPWACTWAGPWNWPLIRDHSHRTPAPALRCIAEKVEILPDYLKQGLFLSTTMFTFSFLCQDNEFQFNAVLPGQLMGPISVKTSVIWSTFSSVMLTCISITAGVRSCFPWQSVIWSLDTTVWFLRA